MRRVSTFSVCLTILCCACGDDTATDAGEGEDAIEVDVPAVDVGSDSGHMCASPCRSDEACCLVDGDTMCMDTRSDALNCGVCGRDCVAEGRGDSCRFGVCVCGNIAQGCAGDRGNVCCPALSADGTNYCANLERDADDCGSCGEACDPLQADICDGGRCRCGNSRDACEGTPESMCCRADVGDTECIDTTTNRLHCGACNNACLSGESCVEGSCTVGETTCADSCVPGELCCGGSCCLRDVCLEGMCTERE